MSSYFLADFDSLALVNAVVCNKSLNSAHDETTECSVLCTSYKIIDGCVKVLEPPAVRI